MKNAENNTRQHEEISDTTAAKLLEHMHTLSAADIGAEGECLSGAVAIAFAMRYRIVIEGHLVGRDLVEEAFRRYGITKDSGSTQQVRFLPIGGNFYRAQFNETTTKPEVGK